MPQRSDSVKKPKIKLTTNTKPSANGTQSPKETASKPPKVKKGSKSKEGDSEKPKKEAPKEPELTPEEKQIRKEVRVFRGSPVLTFLGAGLTPVFRRRFSSCATDFRRDF